MRARAAGSSLRGGGGCAGLGAAQVLDADWLVVESTYGDRRHPTSDPAEELAQVVSRVVARGGTVIIPAFCVGRAQSVLHLLASARASGRIPEVPIFLNSPLAVAATQLYSHFGAELRLEAAALHALSEVATCVTTVEQSKRLNASAEPKVIIAGSGMATGGRVIHHLATYAPDERNAVVLVGFQAAGTRGASLLEHAPQVKIHGEQVPIRAEVVAIDGLSAHAGADELLAWLHGFRRAPSRTFITHGEPAQASALERRIRGELGWECSVPAFGQHEALELARPKRSTAAGRRARL